MWLWLSRERAHLAYARLWVQSLAKPGYWFLLESVSMFFLDAHRITELAGKSMTALLAYLMMCLTGLLINDLAKKNYPVTSKSPDKPVFLTQK